MSPSPANHGRSRLELVTLQRKKHLRQLLRTNQVGRRGGHSTHRKTAKAERSARAWYVQRTENTLALQEERECGDVIGERARRKGRQRSQEPVRPH